MILYITNAYPSKTKPDRGIFNKEQIDSVKEILNEESVKVISIDNGYIGYLLGFVQILFLNKTKFGLL